jgi:hypothetical protein
MTFYCVVHFSWKGIDFKYKLKIYKYNELYEHYKNNNKSILTNIYIKLLNKNLNLNNLTFD